MKKDIITIGTEINTISGIIKVTDFNGSLVAVDEYDIDEEGTPMKVDGNALTLNEIGNLMKQMDGQNHKVSWTWESDKVYVGRTYDDPEGTWEIEGVNKHTVQITCIACGVESNIGAVHEVDREEVEYFCK